MLTYAVACNKLPTCCDDLFCMEGNGPPITVYGNCDGDEYAELPSPGIPELSEDGWWDYVSHSAMVDHDEVVLVIALVNGCSPDDVVLVWR